MTSAQTRALSDRSVEELVLGPGTFELRGPDGRPFYDPDEQAHLRDARLLLGLCLVAGGLSALGLGALLGRSRRRAVIWREISRAGLITVLAVVGIGLVSLVAFDTLFRLFHVIFFPGGNWSFDPGTQRLVQLYPFGFWQVAAASFGLLLVLLGLGAWLLGRWAAARSADTLEAARRPRSAGSGSGG